MIKFIIIGQSIMVFESRKATFLIIIDFISFKSSQFE